jgi:isopenicillin-N N-acyltransferase-like protein
VKPFGTLEVLTLNTDDAFERGVEHGQRLKKSVKTMAELRLQLMLSETDFKTEGEVIELARKHLPILKAFDAELFDELMGIAKGAGISPELVVVINHYTDMRDIRKAPPTDGGCSVIYTPTPHGPLLGQTWDVHGSATEHVFVLMLKDQMVLSVAGCLGMTGMNQHGVAITINNLISTDAQIGIIWPALVRKVLKCRSAEAGRDVVMNAPLGSGHHYVIADQNDLFAIETSGLQKKIIQSSARSPHIHTNHCLDDEMRKTHTVKKTSTTHERFDSLKAIIKDVRLNSPHDIYEAFGRVSLPANPKDLQATATCAAIVMDITHRTALACKGPPSQKMFHNPPIPLSLDLR